VSLPLAGLFCLYRPLASASPKNSLASTHQFIAGDFGEADASVRLQCLKLWRVGLWAQSSNPSAGCQHKLDDLSNPAARGQEPFCSQGLRCTHSKDASCVEARRLKPLSVPRVGNPRRGVATTDRGRECRDTTGNTFRAFTPSIDWALNTILPAGAKSHCCDLLNREQPSVLRDLGLNKHRFNDEQRL